MDTNVKVAREELMTEELAYVTRSADRAQDRIKNILEKMSKRIAEDLQRVRDCGNMMLGADSYVRFSSDLVAAEAELRSLREAKRIVQCINDWGKKS